jgi:hypothetical protein
LAGQRRTSGTRVQGCTQDVAHAVSMQPARAARPRSFPSPLFTRVRGKGDSQKLVCRMPHNSARWSPYGRPETSRLRKVNHYMLHLRIMMRLGGCVPFSQNTDTDKGRGRQVFTAAAHYRRSGCPDMDVYISRLEARNTGLGPSGRRGPTPRLQRRSRRLWRAMVEAGRWVRVTSSRHMVRRILPASTAPSAKC